MITNSNTCIAILIMQVLCLQAISLTSCCYLLIYFGFVHLCFNSVFKMYFTNMHKGVDFTKPYDAYYLVNPS